jgi:hypothetical protein
MQLAYRMFWNFDALSLPREATDAVGNILKLTKIADASLILRLVAKQHTALRIGGGRGGFTANRFIKPVSYPAA